MLPLLQPKLTHRLPAAPQQKQLCICSSLYMLPCQPTPASIGPGCTQLNCKHALTSATEGRPDPQQRLARAENHRRRCLSGHFARWPSAAAHLARGVLPRPMATCMRRETDKRQMHILISTANLLSHFFLSSFLTKPKKAFIPTVNKAEGEQKETSVRRVT